MSMAKQVPLHRGGIFSKTTSRSDPDESVRLKEFFISNDEYN
jgi:hypothetical protein